MSKRFGKARVCDYDAPGGPCTHNYTCGACLAAAPPWFWTTDDGERIPVPHGWDTPWQKDLNS